MPTTPMSRSSHALLSTLIALAVAATCLLQAASAALASQNQLAIMQGGSNLVLSPASTLTQMRSLGVGIVRVTIPWSTIAHHASSRQRPSFNASNPNAYPAASWAPFDAIDRDAMADGIKVLFTPSAGAPLWAQGANPGRYGAHYSTNNAFEPSAADFGQFMRALGTRYSGSFKPPGQSTPLPKVSYWEIWNEPNIGNTIAPQAADGSSVLVAPNTYRALLNAGWAALHASGHGRDTILIGSMTAHGIQVTSNRGRGLPGTYGETEPLLFLRALFCVNNSYQQYRGAAAAVRGCPTTAARSARFRAQNPALFGASGWAQHPYPVNQPPNEPAPFKESGFNVGNDVDLSQIPNLYNALDRLERIYHSSKKFSIWNTEYGYITDPPNNNNPSGFKRGVHYVSQATAAYYINWAEYLSWRNPRIASTMQYLLYDPNPSVGTPEYGGFASGLIAFNGQPKPAYYSYRLPIFLPKTSVATGGSLEVWGDVRPAHFAALDTGTPQVAQVQFAPGSSTSFATVSLVQITNAEGYFDVHVSLPSSGTVRIAWAYPATDTLLQGYSDPLGAVVYSRSQHVTIT